jgi:hypothetical protein
MAGTTQIDYLRQGAAASRPAAPSAATNTLSFYFATDTETLSFYDWNDAAWQDVIVGGQSHAVAMPRGRLTPTTAVPVLSADVLAATTIYYALYNGNQIPLYDGVSFINTTFTELSQATTDATKSPAAVANNSNYDIFGWTDGGTIRATRGPAWTSDTGRGSGAGTTELTRVLGIWLNAVSITNGPAASRGTYLGTIRSNGTASVDMILGGAGVAGGESTNLGVWNAYNRVQTTLLNYDSTDTWTYTTATWRLKNAGASATANRITFVIGLSEDDLTATNLVGASNSSAGIGRAISIGLNSTAAYAGLNTGVDYREEAAGRTASHCATFMKRAPLGFNYVAPLEFSAATGTTTWNGDNGANGTFTGLTINGIFSASVMA